MDDMPPKTDIHPIYLLLLIPYLALVAVPLFNLYAPTFIGIPFFYWYQILWTFLVCIILGLVYFFEERRR